ncbi:hypothetical protein HMPREF9103_01894 [Lentilactobacillus parafarraginis F0439]|uniref:Uncharacterized protein n=1 Tax=Lentilactobacillus parafarraginis F0439 TaxID=797515 RepID=G9ZQ88_9LACO|nr:hypothetical protein HMPREF9103_01894 [Lentilactobacillus parafarraginis F0439]
MIFNHHLLCRMVAFLSFAEGSFKDVSVFYKLFSHHPQIGSI